MSISDKINLILILSGLTQEQLARKLQVTFVTLNSWANGRSNPRQGAQTQINNFLNELLGQEAPAADALAVKKVFIQRKVKETHALILILSREDLLDQIVLSLTYNTNSIEGSTLTEAETAAVLFEDAALSNRTLTEQMEARNHRAALLWLLDAVHQGQKISEEMIRKMHGMLMNGIREDAGVYRNHAVRIVGANVPTANYLKIPDLMKMLVKDCQKKSDDVVARAAEIHARFEQIHPFADGNGRIGRLLLQAMLLSAGIAPAVIKKKKKQFYLKYLNAAQVKGEFLGLEEFLYDAVVAGYALLEK